MTLNRVDGGGTVERIIKMHRAFLAVGIESHLLTIQDDNTFQGETKGDITVLPSLNKRWFIPFPQLSVLKKLVKEADVIHVMNHWTIINVLVCYYAQKFGVPYFTSPAGSLTIFGRSKLKKRYYQRFFGDKILQRSVGIIAITEDEALLIEKMGVPKNDIYLLPNGVDEEEFKKTTPNLLRKKINISNKLPYILFVGRLNAIKGPDLLLEAFIALSDLFPHHLVLSGPDGGMKDALIDIVNEAGLGERVHFSGFVGGELKANAYQEAQFLVIPSRHEAMSIVALEAAICSTPVLLTDQCGFSALAEAGAAVEVEASVVGIKAGLMEMVLSGKDLDKMGKQGYKLVQSQYSWQSVIEQFVTIIQSKL